MTAPVYLLCWRATERAQYCTSYNWIFLAVSDADQQSNLRKPLRNFLFYTNNNEPISAPYRLPSHAAASCLLLRDDHTCALNYPLVVAIRIVFKCEWVVGERWSMAHTFFSANWGIRFWKRDEWIDSGGSWYAGFLLNLHESRIVNGRAILPAMRDYIARAMTTLRQ